MQNHKKQTVYITALALLLLCGITAMAKQISGTAMNAATGEVPATIKITPTPTALPAETILLAQQRLAELYYRTAEATGFLDEATVTEVRVFQQYNRLPITGLLDAQTLACLNGQAVALPASLRAGFLQAQLGRLPEPTPSATPEPTAKPKNQSTVKPRAAATPAPEPPTVNQQVKEGLLYGEYLDWYKTVRQMIEVGDIITVIDFRTGISWKMVRMGGTKHADCETLTAQDTYNFKQACGKWSWERRPVLVLVGDRIIAASIACQPHGFDTVKNNVEGQFCIHFLNSRTHCSNKVCPLHQDCVREAAGLG